MLQFQAIAADAIEDDVGRDFAFPVRTKEELVAQVAPALADFNRAVWSEHVKDIGQRRRDIAFAADRPRDALHVRSSSLALGSAAANI